MAIMGDLYAAEPQLIDACLADLQVGVGEGGWVGGWVGKEKTRQGEGERGEDKGRESVRAWV
jgi:hypothetical protein